MTDVAQPLPDPLPEFLQHVTNAHDLTQVITVGEFDAEWKLLAAEAPDSDAWEQLCKHHSEVCTKAEQLRSSPDATSLHNLTAALTAFAARAECGVLHDEIEEDRESQDDDAWPALGTFAANWIRPTECFTGNWANAGRLEQEVAGRRPEHQFRPHPSGADSQSARTVPLPSRSSDAGRRRTQAVPVPNTTVKSKRPPDQAPMEGDDIAAWADKAVRQRLLDLSAQYKETLRLAGRLGKEVDDDQAARSKPTTMGKLLKRLPGRSKQKDSRRVASPSDIQRLWDQSCLTLGKTAGVLDGGLNLLNGKERQEAVSTHLWQIQGLLISMEKNADLETLSRTLANLPADRNTSNGYGGQTDPSKVQQDLASVRAEGAALLRVINNRIGAPK